MKRIFLLMLIAGLLFQCKSDPKPIIVPKSSTVKLDKEASIESITSGLNSTESAEELKRKIESLRPQNHTPSEPVEIKKVNLGPTINSVMIAKGKKTFQNKCQSCHSLVEKDGPKASSLVHTLENHSPAWFMNMTTAVSMKLGADAKEDALLNKCPTRKYDTRLSFVDSRDFLELLLSLKK